MQIDFHRNFRKLYKKQPPKIKEKFNEQLGIFMNDPFDILLNNHALKGSLKKYRSINVTNDVRAWYQLNNNKIVFIKIGSHSELY